MLRKEIAAKTVDPAALAALRAAESTDRLAALLARCLERPPMHVMGPIKEYGLGPIDEISQRRMVVPVVHSVFRLSVGADKTFLMTVNQVMLDLANRPYEFTAYPCTLNEQQYIVYHENAAMIRFRVDTARMAWRVAEQQFPLATCGVSWGMPTKDE